MKYREIGGEIDMDIEVERKGKGDILEERWKEP